MPHVELPLGRTLPLGRKLPLLISGLIVLVLVASSTAAYIEVWDQYGHPRARYDGAMSSVEEISETEQRQMLVAHEKPPGALDSVHTGPFYSRGDSVFTWYVQPVVSAGLTTGFVAQRIRLTNDAAAKTAQAGLRTIMGPGVNLYLANTSNDLRTTTIGELSSQPPVLKAALGPVMYRDPITGEMLGAKASVPATSWVVQIAMPRAVVLERPLAFLKQISVIALVTLLIGALLAWFISREVTQPLEELTAATNDLSTGEYQRRVRIDRGDELGRLGEAFNLMAQRVAESRAASEQQHAEAEAARREAVAASQAKSDFLAVMSHELRTPLNAILGFSSLMLDGITGPVNEQQRAQLARIRTGGQHLLSLIDEILSLSRLEAQREELHIEHSDAILIARETAALVEPMAALKRLALVTDIPAGTCECQTHVTKLRQILLNLLSNAIKFTNEGAVTFGLCFDDAQMIFVVSDTGIGIAPEHRGRIFEPFYQVEMSKARRVAGTGLGLSVTRHLARLLGGEVDLREQASTGSTFEVRLPRSLTQQGGDSTNDSTGERLAIGYASTPRRNADQPV